MVNGNHSKPKTLRQAKSDYNKRNGPGFSAQQIRQWERARLLGDRAEKLRNLNNRRKDALHRRREREEKDRETRKASGFGLATQLVGFSNTQAKQKQKMEEFLGLKLPNELQTHQECRVCGSQERNEMTVHDNPDISSGPVTTLSAILPSPNISVEQTLRNPGVSHGVVPQTFPSYASPTRSVELRTEANSPNEFDLIEDDILLSALGEHLEQSFGQTVEASPTTEHCRSQSLEVEDLAAIPEEFWATSTQLERDLNEVSSSEPRQAKHPGFDYHRSAAEYSLIGSSFAASPGIQTAAKNPTIEVYGDGQDAGEMRCSNIPSIEFLSTPKSDFYDEFGGLSTQILLEAIGHIKPKNKQLDSQSVLVRNSTSGCHPSSTQDYEVMDISTQILKELVNDDFYP